MFKTKKEGVSLTLEERLKEVEGKIKEIKEKADGVDEDINLSNVLLNKLLESDYKIYKLDNNDINNLLICNLSYSYSLGNYYNKINSLSTNIQYTNLSLDDVQNIGKYDTIKIGKDTYFIDKKETIKKGLKRFKKTKNK